MARSNGHGRSCPCKKLPYALSSWTAAEHGDVHSLMKRQNRTMSGGVDLSEKFDAAGNSPLHLAAQHGHVAATAALLTAGCSVNGIWDRRDQNQNHEPATNIPTRKSGMSQISFRASTPLHRASYSGAVGTMQLLMAQPSCQLLVADTSFGDGRTALHKAVAGGRPLAVQLLLTTLEDRQLLNEAWKVRDSQQYTPLELARVMHTESPSTVARWDEVAGGESADWKACLRLMEAAESRLTQEQEQQPSNLTMRNSKTSSQNDPLSAPLQLHRLAKCLDCDDSSTTGGACIASTWEKAFWKALSNEARDAVQDERCMPIPEDSQSQLSFLPVPSRTDGDSSVELAKDLPLECVTTLTATHDASADEQSPQQEMGTLCQSCGKRTIAVYKVRHLRVCRPCRKLVK